MSVEADVWLKQCGMNRVMMSPKGRLHSMRWIARDLFNSNDQVWATHATQKVRPHSPPGQRPFLTPCNLAPGSLQLKTSRLYTHCSYLHHNLPGRYQHLSQYQHGFIGKCQRRAMRRSPLHHQPQASRSIRVISHCLTHILDLDSRPSLPFMV